MNSINDPLTELRELNGSDRVFPYDDCVLTAKSWRNSVTSPELRCLSFRHRGLSKLGPSNDSGPLEKIEEVHRHISSSFFERFPEDAMLRGDIESDAIPQLRAAIARADETRALLRRLLEELKSETRRPK